MRTNLIKTVLASLITIPFGCWLSQGAGFTTDFNSGLPAGSVVVLPSFIDTSGGVANSGVLKLTGTAGSQQGAFFINDFSGGNAVTNFRASYRVAIGGGTTRPADGMSFCFATDLPAPPGTFTEEGAGTGICVTFDTWDNSATGGSAAEGGDDTAPAIDVRYGGARLAFQSMDTGGAGNPWRDLNRAPAGPILTNSAGNNVSLQTLGPGPATPTDSSFVDVVIELSADNTISVSWSNVVVFDHLPIAYVPISSGTFAFGARTGGAYEDHWVDNLQIYANFTPGPVVIVGQPTDQTVTETISATFSMQLDGTPPYTVQWFSNNVAIAGADQPTYTAPPATLAMNGTLYHAQVSNVDGPTPIVSANARLTVNAGTLVQSVSSRGQPDQVFVVFSKPVNLDGSYALDNLAFIVGSPAYGASHSEVVLSTDTLVADINYTLTVSGVTGADGSTLVPDPTAAVFHQGFGAFCHDFDDNVLPAGTVLGGVATLTDGSIHLTENGVTGACGEYFIPDQNNGSPLANLHARWRSLIGSTGSAADGYSFNWGTDVTGGCSGSQEGAGTGLSVTVDTFDNGCGDCANGTDTGLEMRWKGNRVAYTHTSKAFLAKNEFVDADVVVTPDGMATFNYDTVTMTAPLPGFGTGIRGGNFSFVATTGGASESAWIDDLCINNATLGPLTFTLEPVDTIVLVGDPAVFTTAVDGSYPYRYQWRTNGVPVPGANGPGFTIPVTTRAMEGLVASVTVSNDFSLIVSSPATLHVDLSPRVLSVFSRNTADVHVIFTTEVDLGTPNDSSYTLLGSGLFEFSRSYGSSHKEVIVTFDSPLALNTVYTLSVADVASEGAGPLLFINPTNVVFQHGFGAFCQDFNDNLLPAGAAIGGVATLGGPDGTDGIVHLTDDGQNGVCGTFMIADQYGGVTLDRLQARWKSLIGGVDQPGEAIQLGTGGADGYSFNWGTDLPSSGCGNGVEGAGTGLSVTVDTFDNGGGEAPGIEIRWGGARVAFDPTVAGDQTAAKAFLRKNQFVDAELTVTPAGQATFIYDGVVINATLPGFSGFAGGKFLFAASTGGAQDNQWVDNVRLNCFSLGALAITQQPADLTLANPLDRATVAVDVDGVFPYSFQWYSNNVAIAGATSRVYTSPPLAQGASYKAIVNNSDGSVTSRVAVVTVALTERLNFATGGDGTVNLTWGSGFKLQGTSLLATPSSATVWQDLPYTSPLAIPRGYFGTGNTNVFFRLISK